MVELNIEEQRTKYQAELDSFIRQLQQLNQQRAMLLAMPAVEQFLQIEQQRPVLVEAIAERRGILAFLNSLKNEHKEIQGEQSAS